MMLHHLPPVLLMLPILMIVLPLTLHLNLHRLCHVHVMILILNRMGLWRRRWSRRWRRGHRPTNLSRVRMAVVRPSRRLVRVGEPPRREADPAHWLTGVGRRGGGGIVPTATADAASKGW